jgi:hypothetical protein
VTQVQRIADAVLQVAGVGAAGDLLDDHASGDVGGVGVLLRGTRLKVDRMTQRGVHHLPRTPVLEAVRENPLRVVETRNVHRRQTGRVVEQRVHRDPRIVGREQPGQVALHRLVEVDPVLLRELKHHHGGVDLGGAADPEVPVGSNWSASTEVGNTGGTGPLTRRAGDPHQGTGRVMVGQPRNRVPERDVVGRWQGGRRGRRHRSKDDGGGGNECDNCCSHVTQHVDPQHPCHQGNTPALEDQGVRVATPVAAYEMTIDTTTGAPTELDTNRPESLPSADQPLARCVV